MFWVVTALLTLAVGALLARPLLRAPDGPAPENPDVALYKAQLAEIDRDRERGTIEAAEAEIARAEVARRLLAASRDPRRASAGRSSPALAGALLAALLGVAVLTYLSVGTPGEADQPLQARLEQAEEIRRNRPSQAELQALAPAVEPPADASAEYIEQIDRLREMVPQRPDDLQGWQLLALHEGRLGNYPAAMEAQSNVLRILGEDPPLPELVRLADLMVLAANGYVSPEAEAVLARVREGEPENIAVSYYYGALYNQTGRPDIAFRAWRPLAEAATQGYYQALARAQIEDAAARAGISYALPEPVGPSAEDMAAAEDMSEEDRAAMIEGMVARLSDRLATQGGPVEDWARLIGAYGVLGETGRAQAIYDEALSVFEGSAEAISALNLAAQDAGLVR